jgi:hypothetical protein
MTRMWLFSGSISFSLFCKSENGEIKLAVCQTVYTENPLLFICGLAVYFSTGAMTHCAMAQYSCTYQPNIVQYVATQRDMMGRLCIV